MNITDHDIYMETNRLAVLATTVIERAMKRADLSRSELAASLGLPRSRVTKVLDGETNMTLRTLASFGLACGVRWQFDGVAVSDGTLALDWCGVDMASDEPAQLVRYGDSDFGLSVAELKTGVPLLCSALDASQDPIGPLLPGPPLHHLPDSVSISSRHQLSAL